MTVEETDESFQLKKFQDPSNDQQRQDYLALLEKFGAFLGGEISIRLRSIY